MEAKIGAKVWVYAMGSYYAGEIVKFGVKKLEPSGKPMIVYVRYASGAGKVREKSLNLNEDGSYSEKYLKHFPLVEIKEGEPKPKGSRGGGRSRAVLPEADAAIARREDGDGSA